MLYVAIWYVSIRPVVKRVKEELQFFLHPHNNSIRKLLKMYYWSPKHVELLNVMNKINHQILCILLDYRYMFILSRSPIIINIQRASSTDRLTCHLLIPVTLPCRPLVRGGNNYCSWTDRLLMLAGQDSFERELMLPYLWMNYLWSLSGQEWSGCFLTYHTVSSCTLFTFLWIPKLIFVFNYGISKYVLGMSRGRML